MARKKAKSKKKAPESVQRPHADGAETRRRIMTAAQLISRHTPRQDVLKLLQQTYNIGERQAERYYQKGEEELEAMVSPEANSKTLGAMKRRLEDWLFFLNTEPDPRGTLDDQVKVYNLLIKNMELVEKQIRKGGDPSETSDDSGPDISDDLAAVLKSPAKKR